ncbi:hypothetical protein DB346_02935 [Verrucomicrobia bacterium LW23]|nr:hypothetical protein DB346_03720 [Verrucomicrobia bacterium LW23]PTY04404.1 hypothetical protein DB346_02935 [Verrucomicrobia bacterium LW23]
MKPVDFRNETFAQLQERFTGLRRAVYMAWMHWGPGTTREVSVRAKIDILTFRPRTTELFQLGFLELVEHQPTGTEGVYRVVPEKVVQARWERRFDEPEIKQLPLL